MIKRLLNKQGGFTLVELLIVIAVIGILAVAVLAALDPIEQLKKSRDTAKLADARELLGAYQRFYASRNCFPADSPACASTTLRASVATSNAAITADMTTMQTAGELKASFNNKNSITRGWLFVGLTNTGVLSVCFPAESQNARGGALGGAHTMDTTTGAITEDAAFNCAAPYNAAAQDPACMICVQ